ncbi:uncharacterized protein BDW47DRAFT_15653 [Aspergillus candidus]|uniref:Uncharacterized protein n=1 Tax=Aspergillus candidus TaxID=41067 RepID=A0A2I2FFK5_ASPCN|nr:hypothetical protein BDW47DRAFT_15653 [Aspergillus candidus]PLB39391.1 hypothetical protein BDW47DRAFT_15653 [Aspergillus candidus]
MRFHTPQFFFCFLECIFFSPPLFFCSYFSCFLTLSCLLASSPPSPSFPFSFRHFNFVPLISLSFPSQVVWDLGSRTCCPLSTAEKMKPPRTPILTSTQTTYGQRQDQRQR